MHAAGGHVGFGVVVVAVVDDGGGVGFAVVTADLAGVVVAGGLGVGSVMKEEVGGKTLAFTTVMMPDRTTSTTRTAVGVDILLVALLRRSSCVVGKGEEAGGEGTGIDAEMGMDVIDGGAMFSVAAGTYKEKRGENLNFGAGAQQRDINERMQ